jgi:PAS domain S-box-containing protein
MSLKQWLTRLIWLCIAPLLLLAAVLAVQQVKQIHHEQQQTASALGLRLAGAMDQYLDQRIQALQVLALSPLAVQASQRPAFYQAAQSFQQIFGHPVLLADSQQQSLFFTKQPFGTVLPTLVRGRSTAQAALSTGQPAISPVFTGTVTQQQQIVIAVPVPHSDPGTTLLVFVSIAEFQRQLDVLALPAGWTATLRDGQGMTLARRPPAAPTLNQIDETARRFTAAPARVPWSVELEIPQALYRAPAEEAILTLGLALLGATLAAMLGGTLASRRIGRAVATLATPTSVNRRPDISDIDAVHQQLRALQERREAAEAAHRDSEQRTRAVFEQAAVGLCLTSPDGRLQQANQTLCDLLGYTAAELQGRAFTDFTHPDEQATNWALYLQLRAGDISTIAHEKRYLCKDGTTVWCHVTLSRMAGADGNFQHTIAAVVDIQRRKEAEAQLQLKEAHLQELNTQLEQRVAQRTAELSSALADSASARDRLQRSRATLAQAVRLAQLGAWTIELSDPANFGLNPTTWSDEMYRLMGYTRQALPQPTFDAFLARIHPDDQVALMASAERAVTAQSGWQLEYRVCLPDGSQRVLLEKGEVTANAQGQAVLIDGAVLDITVQRALETQLRTSQARLHLALKGAGAGTYEWNQETGTDTWSDELWPLLGLVPKAAPACLKTWRQTVHPVDLKAANRIMAQAASQRAEFEIEWRVQLPPGEPTRWLLARASPMHGRAGRVSGYSGIIMDITARKQAELALTQYREHLQDLVLERTAELASANAEQRRLGHALRLLSDCNIAVVRAQSESELLHELCQLVVESGGYRMGWVGLPEHDAAKTVHAAAQFGDEQGYLADLAISWDAARPSGRGPMGCAIRNGQTQIVQDCQEDPQTAPWHAGFRQHGFQSCVALPLVSEQQVLGAFVLYSSEPLAFARREVQLLEELASDMAFGLQSLRARHALERSQRLLEQRVVERTAEIATLNTELKARVQDAEMANLAKSAFLATMSHELRTPLNAVVGLTGLLADSPLGRRQRNYADKIELAAQALRALIDDILDFSKIEAGELRLEQAPFSLNQVLRTTAAVVGVGLRDKALEVFFDVAPDIPDALLGDALRLQQILLNLTSNAVKFTPAGVVVVAVNCGERSAAEVTLQFSVRDTGIGIAASQLDRIFQGFIQADSSTSRKYGGSGLGLAISDRLARLMGGTIQVQSAEQVGSQFCFEVTLPLDPTPMALAEPPAALRLLIVDDHPMARDVLQRSCTGLGWQATTVASGAAGLAELQRSSAAGEDYDLLLLDWRMPEMDGLEMLRRAYATPALGLPLVLLMAPLFETEQAAAASDDIFLDAIVSKPLTPDSLREGVARALVGDVQGMLPRLHKKDRRLTGMRLLVAEDNELNQEVIAQILGRAGASVVIAADGRAAVEALRPPAARFDAVLMDIQMPVMDGYTATQIIREELGRLTLPIIAVTAFARPEDRERSRRAGMVGHLVKPINVEDLLDLVAREHHPVALIRRAGAAPSAPAGQSLPGLQISAALNNFGGNEAKYHQLLRQFSARHGDDAQEASRLFQAHDKAGASRLVHGLSGMASMLHATELARLASVTEAALLEERLDVLPVLFEELQAAMLQLVQSIEQFEPA